MWLVRKAKLTLTAFSSAALIASQCNVAHAASADRQAYDAAMKCFVVIGNAVGERQRAHDAAKANSYEQKAHATWEVALKLGRNLGISGPQIADDFEAMRLREQRRLVSDADYNRQAAATCKAMGFL